MKRNVIIFIFVLFLCIGAIGGIYCYNKTQKYIKTSNEGMTAEPYIPNGMEVSNQNTTQAQVKEKQYNRSPKNVTIEVVQDTITNEN